MRQVRFPAGLPSSLLPDVWRLSTAAYQVEADIIGDDRIPVLHLGPDAIDVTGDWRLWLAGPDSSRVVAACHLETGHVETAHVETGHLDPGHLEAGHDSDLELERLVVDPDYARRGLGSALLAAVLTDQALAGRGVRLGTGWRNRPALALYQHFGFTPDPDYGADGISEPLPGLRVQRLRWRGRTCTRVLTRDDVDQVLLVGWRDPLTAQIAWEPPGGGLLPDEAPEDGARREVAEETGLDVTLLGEPVRVPQDYVWAGHRSIWIDLLFQARAAGREPIPDPSRQELTEQAAYVGHRWVPAAELLGALSLPDAVRALLRTPRT